MTTPPKEDDPTPVPPYRRSTGSITAWGIVEAWLSACMDNRIEHRMGVNGHEVRARRSDLAGIWEPVRPNEDPSATAVRAFGKLP